MVHSKLTILERITAGDTAAVAACLDEYGGMVLALARRYNQSVGDDPDDAVQEVFIEVWRHAARYRPSEGSEASFIATIAHRRLIDRRRKHLTRATHTQNEHSLDTGTSAPVSAIFFRSPSDPEDLAQASQAFESLTPDEKQVVWLAICQGHSHERVAAILKAPLGTVKTRIRRGLMRLRELMSTHPTPTQGAQAAAPRSQEGGRA